MFYQGWCFVEVVCVFVPLLSLHLVASQERDDYVDSFCNMVTTSQ